MKKFFNEFKTFISRGNVIDLAIAVIIGAAFGKITTSLVNDILMPLISLVVGGHSVADWKWVITAEHIDTSDKLIAENALYYGNFIQSIIDFLLIAIVVFVILKIFNAANKGLGELATLENALTKAEVKQLRKEGKTAREIRQIKLDRLAEQKRLADQKAKQPAIVPPTQSEILLAEIRDLLREQDKDAAKTEQKKSR